MGEANLIAILQGRNEDEKVEVHAYGRNGRPRLQFRYMTWGPGIGWFCQKSIELEAEQEAQLFEILQQRKKWVTHQRRVIGSNIIPLDLKSLLKTG